jgi:Predicted membrane protein (DUF2254)
MSRRRRQWLFPIALLAIVSLALFALFYLLDSRHNGSGGVSGYFGFESGMITDALPSLAAMTAAVLGIVITVVSIIVQLSSERYTGVAQMFLRDRINIGVMAYFVIACVCGVWLSMAVKAAFVPHIAIVAMLVFTTLGLVVMLPYFAYVFRFLEPSSIVARIRSQAVDTVERAVTAKDATSAVAIQGEVLAAMEELTDITSNSISGKDKIIASRSVDAIKDFVVGYLAHKAQAPTAWFAIGPTIRDNPDFVAMDPESLRDLETRRHWVEWKALRQYLGIYNEAQGAMPDINYLVAIDTRYIGEAAAARGDEMVVRLVLRFMNSYLRSTINAKAVRTAYNVLNQYRLLVETMIKRGDRDLAADAVGHMIYYGRTSYDLQLGFITETVAYDVGALCELAHHHGGGDALLTQFLELDQPLRAKRQEGGLIGIRKAQVKLACFYLAAGADDPARRIADDMRGEPAERLRTIREQLERVESKDFWEIIDRGRNFEYMPESQRRQMATYFGWLDVA